MSKSFEDLELNVLQWAEARGIFESSTGQAQVLKAVSEMGELADAVIKRNQEEIKDAIGDTIVCLINAAAFYDTDIVECLNDAYETIKNRRGKMVSGGAFVKESA